MPSSNGSMMDATVAKPGDLAQAQQHLLQAMLPDTSDRRQLPLHWMPVARSVSLLSAAIRIAAGQHARATTAAIAAPIRVLEPGAAGEALALAEGVGHRWMLHLQAQWWEGLTDLGREASRVQQSNTLSKVVEHETNLLLQGLELVIDQTIATVTMVENVQIGLAWWLSHRASK